VTWPELTAVLEQFLAHPPYQPAFLLVHPEIGRLQTAVNRLQQEYAWPALAVSSSLSHQLQAIAPQQRPRHTPRLFLDNLQPYAPGPLLCHEIDLLFEPSLRLDPLKLLLDGSRHTSLIIAWPGHYADNSLSYAVPKHAHYRVWSRPDLCAYCVAQL
jgi:hypothetical protein